MRSLAARVVNPCLLLTKYRPTQGPWIDPAQAAIVRRIFCEYADGLAPRAVATRLNQEGVPSPRGGHWNASMINGNRQRRNGIINNELYIGRITYNRQRSVCITPQRISILELLLRFLACH